MVLWRKKSDLKKISSFIYISKAKKFIYPQSSSIPFDNVLSNFLQYVIGIPV